MYTVFLILLIFAGCILLFLIQYLQKKYPDGWATALAGLGAALLTSLALSLLQHWSSATG